MSRDKYSPTNALRLKNELLRRRFNTERRLEGIIAHDCDFNAKSIKKLRDDRFNQAQRLDTAVRVGLVHHYSISSQLHT